MNPTVAATLSGFYYNNNELRFYRTGFDILFYCIRVFKQDYYKEKHQISFQKKFNSKFAIWAIELILEEEAFHGDLKKLQFRDLIPEDVSLIELTENNIEASYYC